MIDRDVSRDGGMGIAFDVTDLTLGERAALLTMLSETLEDQPPAPVPMEVRIFTGDDDRERVLIWEANRPYGATEGVKHGTTPIIFPVVAGGATDVTGPRK